MGVNSSKRILVAEDNQVMADVVRFNLKRAGYDVTIASTGAEAWEILQDAEFDLLVTDFQMPKMNGDELCRKILEKGEYAMMPIIMCSAKGFELNAEQLKAELNISQLIYKPFSPIQLKQMIADVFENTAGVT